MGWNALTFLRPAPILRGLEPGCSVYFVHSFHAVAANPDDVAAESEHGTSFPAIVWRDNLTGCQFHPEKSQKVGLEMYKNFAEV